MSKCAKSSHTQFLNGLLMLTPSCCTLLVTPPGTTVSVAMEPLLQSDVFSAQCTSAYWFLLDDSEVGGLWIILFQSSSIHLFIITSSHHVFGWNVTLTLRSYCFFSEAFICSPFPPKIRRSDNVLSAAKLINWTVHWRFTEAWLTTSYLKFISNGFA